MRRGGMYARCLWPDTWVWGCPQKCQLLKCIWETECSTLYQRRGKKYVQLQAEAQVRKLEQELKLKKDVQLSTTLLASGLADKMEEQNNKLNTLVWCFTKLGGYKLPRIRSECLWQSLTRMLRGRIPEKVWRAKGRMWWLTMKQTECPVPSNTSQIQKKIINSLRLLIIEKYTLKLLRRKLSFFLCPWNSKSYHVWNVNTPADN